MAKKAAEVNTSRISHTKEQLLRSERYAKRRDLLTALLEDDKQYTLKEVDTAIEKFLKGKVN